MRIGYPCINWTIGCKGDKTFRLKSYSDQRLIDTVENNLSCLFDMLHFNVAHDLLFFRITSDLIPFASHPVYTFNWQHHFCDQFAEIGNYIKRKDIRISMHPDQFIVINSPNQKIVDRAIAELQYHAEVLDLMHVDTTGKIQLHVGGVYKDKSESIKRFINRYQNLPEDIQKRLVIENDDVSYSLIDCLDIYSQCGIPILSDYHHHNLLNNNESFRELFKQVKLTWSQNDGIPLVDYSSQKINGRPRAHADHIDIQNFKTFLLQMRPYDFDIMLEIKDKQASALKAINVIHDMQINK